MTHRRNRISFVVSFDKPEGAKISDLRERIADAIRYGYPYAGHSSDGWPDWTTFEIHRLRKPPS